MSDTGSNIWSDTGSDTGQGLGYADCGEEFKWWSQNVKTLTLLIIDPAENYGITQLPKLRGGDIQNVLQINKSHHLLILNCHKSEMYQIKFVY